MQNVMSSKEGEMTDGRSIQGVWEDFTKELNLKWALMVRVDLRGQWRGENIPSWLTS